MVFLLQQPEETKTKISKSQKNQIVFQVTKNNNKVIETNKFHGKIKPEDQTQIIVLAKCQVVMKN